MGPWKGQGGCCLKEMLPKWGGTRGLPGEGSDGGQRGGDKVQGGSGGLGRVTLRERSEAAGRTENIKGPQDLLVLKTTFTTKSSGNGVRGVLEGDKPKSR